MPSVREIVGNRPLIISFLKFEALSGTGLQCCEDGFLWEEIKCEATHPSFKQPISQYFKLVYDGLTKETNDGYAPEYPEIHF